MKEPLRLLIVEDYPDDAELMVMRLEEEGFKPEWKRVENEVDFLKALEDKPDFILADWLSWKCYITYPLPCAT